MTDQINLTPCPFCGGPPVPHSRDVYGDSAFACRDFEGGDYIDACVFCHECGAQGPVVEGLADSAADFAEIERKACLEWNARNARHAQLYEAAEAGGLNVYPREIEQGN